MGKCTTTNVHPSINFWIWGGTHTTVKGTWPGDAITTIETVDGKKWLTKEFLITTSNDAVNFVFSVGTGTPQTVDIENIKTTTFINISSEKTDTKHKVNVVTTKHRKHSK